MHKQIKVVVIGAGKIAEEHIKAFNAQNNCNVIGIFSRTKSKAQIIADNYKILNIADSIEDLSKLSPDIVVIAVSIESTETICYQAFKYPWIILVEKPVGLDYKNACLIYENSIKLKSKVFVALNRRQYASTLNAIRLLDNDSSNRFVIVNDQEDPILQINSGMNLDIVNNLMYTNSIHLFDYFKIFCRGEVNKIHISEKWNGGKNNIVTANLDFDSGDRGLYVGIWDMPAPWSVSIVTNKTNILLKPLEQISVQQYGLRKSETFETSEYDKQFKPGFYIQAQNAVKAAKGQEHSLVDLPTTLKTMKLIKDLYEI